MTTLEIFAYFVIPVSTVALAAAGYLIVRVTSVATDPDPFYYPIFKYDSAREFSCVSPRLKRQIFNVFPAEIAVCVEADMEHVLRNTIEDSPDDFHRTLKIFQRDLKATRVETILSRLSLMLRPPTARTTGGALPSER